MLGLALLSLGFFAAALAAFKIAFAGAATKQRKFLVGAAFGCVLLSGVLYMAIGKPTMPDQPFAARLETLRKSDLLTMPTEAVEVLLQDALRRDPNDPRPHAFYGRVLMSEGRYDEALRAFMGALRRDPKFADALAGVGQSLLAINGGPTPQAIEALEAAMAAMPPDEPRRERIGTMVAALKPLLNEPAAEAPAKASAPSQ